MVLVFGTLFARGVSVGDQAPLLEVEDSYGKKVNLQSPTGEPNSEGNFQGGF